ncbi:MAG: excinuclease ABC subunit UvrC [Deferribacteraceae bacterium]|jgi:excinuclease ABC subunit C|nr:excinuclease ABC subunit UvrC [Deferribacteraceae bacterium]
MFEINLADIPTSPGVYLFLGLRERIIYVGKAKNLRNRLSSYFNAGAKSIKTERMLAVARSVRTIVTNSEVEAFLLEMNLIKTEQPKYNILLKDSKGYPYAKLTNEEYPRLLYTRKTDDHNSQYFGPFVSGSALKETIEYMQGIFPLRTCTNTQLKAGKICLKYQIKKCVGPCEQCISQDNYNAIVGQVKRFFKGETEEIRHQLKDHMEQAAEKMNYEEAAFYRDRLRAINTLFAKQQAINTGETRNLDLFYKYDTEHTASVTQLFVRGGRLIGAKTHFFSNDEDELLERFIMQFYANIRQYPELIVAEGEEVSDGLAEGIAAMAGRKITIRKRGYKELISLAKKNAEHAVIEYTLKATAGKDLFVRLAKICDREMISRVECMDISHLGGDNTVGVSVVSEEGSFYKKDYRKYKIKSVDNNDVHAIKELMTRKMENVAEGSETEADLYLIDGGISQLNAAVKALAAGGSSAACLSISKSRSLRPQKHDSEESIEEIHAPGRKNPLKFRKNDPVLLFLQKMRDEAHRFAITYSRNLSLKKRHVSPLLEIAGMGEKRAKALLTAIPDLYTNESISAEQIHEKAKLPMELAEKVLEFVKASKGF